MIASLFFTSVYLLRIFLNMEGVLGEMVAIGQGVLCTRMIGFASQASVLRYVGVEAENPERRDNVPVFMEQKT